MKDICTLLSAKQLNPNSHQPRHLRLLNPSRLLLFVAPSLLQVPSPNPGLLRPIPLSSPRLPRNPPNNNPELSSLSPRTIKANPKGEELTTQRESDYRLSLSLVHFLKGFTPPASQVLPSGTPRARESGPNWSLSFT